jgi:hypothetical protein
VSRYFWQGPLVVSASLLRPVWLWRLPNLPYIYIYVAFKCEWSVTVATRAILSLYLEYMEIYLHGPQRFLDIIVHNDKFSRSQWRRGLRHEQSSPAQTLGSWVRIPLEAWMSVCFYFVFVLFCLYVATLRRADSPSKESYRLCTVKHRFTNLIRSWRSFVNRNYFPHRN